MLRLLEKWKGMKLNRGASHIPGGGRLLRPGWGGSRGWQQQAPRGPGHSRAHTVPRSLRSGPVTMVARLAGGVGLAATWDHLGLFPSRTSGVAERAEEGRAGGNLRPLCSRSIRRRGGRSRASPPGAQRAT